MRFRLMGPALIGLALLGCGRGDAPGDLGSETTPLEREMRGFMLTETLDGRRLWELTADHAWRLPDASPVRMETVRIVFFDSEGEVSSVLTSREGRVEEKTEDLTATGAVRVVTTDGDTLETEELHYRKEEDLLRGPGFVRLARRDRVLTGTEFEATPDLTHYEVKRDVHVTILDDGHVVDHGP